MTEPTDVTPEPALADEPAAEVSEQPPPMDPFSQSEEWLILHAQEILPHLGPEATVVYLERALSALPPEHEAAQA